jgi:hypothetical protein
MTTTDSLGPPPRRLGRSVLAVAAGLGANVLLAMAADQVAYAAGLFPQPPEVTYETGPYVIATAYRALFGVAGAWLTARLAPSAGMRHALILGGIGLALCAAGLIAAFTMKLGPVWYPLALLLVTLPCAWLGGRLAMGGRR